MAFSFGNMGMESCYTDVKHSLLEIVEIGHGI